jgi:hypothetical protein
MKGLSGLSRLTSEIQTIGSLVSDLFVGTMIAVKLVIAIFSFIHSRLLFSVVPGIISYHIGK